MPKDRSSPEQPAGSWKHDCSACGYARLYWFELFEMRPEERQGKTVDVGDGKRMAVDLPIDNGKVRELGLRQVIEAHWKGFTQALDLMEHLGAAFTEERRTVAADMWREAAIARLEKIERAPFPKSPAARFSYFVDMARLKELRGGPEFTPSLFQMLAEEIFEGKIPAWVQAASRGWKAATQQKHGEVTRAVNAIVREVTAEHEDRRSV